MKIFQETKTATCRACQSKFSYTDAEKPALPMLCWECSDKALAEFDRLPPRRREQKCWTPF